MNIRRLLRLPKTTASILFFLGRNLWQAAGIPTIPNGGTEEVAFVPCTADLSAAVENLYSEFHPGKKLGHAKRCLLKLAGKRLCLVVLDRQSGESVGFSLFYFNRRDVEEATVHEGFTGILPKYQGRGIGSAQRRHALEHFARRPSIKGVSSRVSLNNLPSLRGNLNLGFREKERYFDADMGEERVYLICDLARYREASAKSGEPSAVA